ncbi:Os03g0789600, partial [Oryza sativa Japonica Group]
LYTLTCGAHVGPMLTQPPHRTKPGSKPPKDLK